MSETMKNTTRRRRLFFRRGTTSVEFALTVPLFLAFLFGALEFGRANMIRHTAQNAAYEAARAAIVPGATAAKAEAAAYAALSYAGIGTATVTITPSVLGPGDNEVTVDVSVPMDPNSYLTPLFLSGKNLEATSTLSREITGL
jgi:Flp pilus assembly protein TadG